MWIKMLHTTLRGRPALCSDASERHYLVGTFATTAPQPAGTSPPHLLRQTLASQELQMFLLADTYLQAQPKSSWAETESDGYFLFLTHPSGDTSGVISDRLHEHVSMSGYAVFVCTWESCTSRVKDTKSWTKLPTGLKAIMNPFAICKCDKKWGIVKLN